MEEYSNIYEQSIGDNDAFWAMQAERIYWFKKWNTISENNYHKAQIRWFEGGQLNASYNCIDRHIKDGFGDKHAIIWEGNDPSENKYFTYNKLLDEVSLFANGLKSLGVVKGDRVCIYMQMVPELAIAMLACARIGAVH